MEDKIKECEVDCPECGGEGTVTDTDMVWSYRHDCPLDRIKEYECDLCNGSGVAWQCHCGHLYSSDQYLAPSESGPPRVVCEECWEEEE